MKAILYGDGIHDDYPAIQEMIDSGVCEVILPAPKNHYLISETLELPSNFKLTLPRFAEIKLADSANCLMVSNKKEPNKGDRLPKDLSELCQHLWYYVNDYSSDKVTENIEISGGIWNCNNLNQLPNPEQTEGFGPYGYTGDGMLCYGVKNLKISSITVKDPVHWGISIDRVSYFTIEDITFDYNLGNPMAINMDGIHLNGNCHYGKISNLKGACYDDMVAVNAHEGSRGPISNIDIDGLFAERCHSAVRLLTVNDVVENIHISNVYGTYYQYCIGLTKYYPGELAGMFRDICMDHIYASKASRDGIYPWPDSYVFPFIFMQDDIRAKNVKITNLFRKEYCNPIETIHVGHNVEIDTLILDNIFTENHTGKEMPFMVKHGNVKGLVTSNIIEE